MTYKVGESDQNMQYSQQAQQMSTGEILAMNVEENHPERTNSTVYTDHNKVGRGIGDENSMRTSQQTSNTNKLRFGQNDPKNILP